MSLLKCGRDSTGIKCQTCIVRDSCQLEQWWFHKKSAREAHKRNAHDIYMVLLRGLKIEEEKQSTSRKSTTTSFSGSRSKVHWISSILHEKIEDERQLWVQLVSQSAKVEKIVSCVPDHEYVLILTLHSSNWVHWMHWVLGWRCDNVLLEWMLRRRPTRYSSTVNHPMFYIVLFVISNLCTQCIINSCHFQIEPWLQAHFCILEPWLPAFTLYTQSSI